MGIWGYKVLDNDYALDTLDSYLDSTEQFGPFVGKLLTKGDEYNQLLGIAIVCISLHGVDMDWDGILGSYATTSNSYIHFFESLSAYAVVGASLKPRAKSAIASLIAYGVDDWSADVQKSRINLYHELESLLN